MVSCACALFAVPKIAVLNPTMDKTIDEVVSTPIVDKILEELLKSRKFNILDRASRDVIWEERNFQISSGEINQTEIKNIGQGLGADYVVVVKVKRIGTLYSMSTTMINVETLEVVAQSSAEAKDSIENLLQLASYCGEQLADSVSGTGSTKEGPVFLSDSGAKGTDAGKDKIVPADPGADEAALYQLKTEVRAMLKSGTFLKTAGQDKIAAKVGAMPLQDRRSLYDEYNKEAGMAVLGMLLNMIPLPIPIGSLVQGDWGGFFGYGLVECASLAIFSYCLDDEDLIGGDAYTISSLVFTVAWICSWIQPYTYNANWNKKLSRSLNVIASLGPQDPEIKMATSPRGGTKTEARATLVSFQY
jgi:TolB-like protein